MTKKIFIVEIEIAEDDEKLSPGKIFHAVLDVAEKVLQDNLKEISVRKFTEEL